MRRRVGVWLLAGVSPSHGQVGKFWLRFLFPSLLVFRKGLMVSPSLHEDTVVRASWHF